jgi:predicted ATPase
LELRLKAALGTSLNYTTGPVPETEAAWTRTLEIAKSLGDTEYQLRALRGLWAYWMNGGEYRSSLALAYEFGALAATTNDPGDLLVADRMAGIILHYLGDQTGARRHIERRLGDPLVPARQSQSARFAIDPRVAVPALRARILWLQGFPDQAERSARLAVDEATATSHALSLCHALAQAACGVALFNGDIDAAEGFTTILLNRAKELGLAGWIARGHCFQGALLIMQDDFAAGLPLLRGALDELRESGAAPGYPAFQTVLASGLGRARQATQGLAVINQALAFSERHEERWSLPEILRIKGELLLLECAPATAAAEAEDHFRQALDWARRQSALSWELRAATSLARLLCNRHLPAEGLAILQPVYERFTEGFNTADLRSAKALLDALGQAGSGTTRDALPRRPPI